jgi:IclR family KDG regulon transcriptional repressor
MRYLSSLKKALRVLEVFSADHPERSLSEISRLLHSHKSSVSRILVTLASEGFVEKNPLNHRYRLGLRLLDLANRVLSRYDLRDEAAPFLEDLARRTGEIIHLSVLDKNQIVYIEKRGEGQALTVATRVGGRNPAHASAMGKVLLSGLSQKELDEVLAVEPLARLTPKTITQIPKLLRELEQVRTQGFAVDDEESFPGVRCAAGPIYGRGGRMTAAISATVPKQRMGKKRIDEIRKQVVEAAQLISERLARATLGE